MSGGSIWTKVSKAYSSPASVFALTKIPSGFTCSRYPSLPSSGVRAVYGNMDDYSMHYDAPKTQLFNCEGLRVVMTHIGGWPGHYPQEMLALLKSERPDIFVSAPRK